MILGDTVHCPQELVDPAFDVVDDQQEGMAEADSLVREAVANVGFDDLAAMQEPVVQRCRWLIDRPEVVRGAVGFQWAVELNG